MTSIKIFEFSRFPRFLLKIIFFVLPAVPQVTLAEPGENGQIFPWQMEMSYMSQRIIKQAKECDPLLNKNYQGFVGCMGKAIQLGERAIEMCKENKGCVEKGENIPQLNIINAELYAYRGYGHMVNKNMSHAATDGNKAMSLDPNGNSSGALFWFSFALIGENRIDEAKPLIQELHKMKASHYTQLLDSLIKNK